MKDKNTAAILALFTGVFGGHNPRFSAIESHATQESDKILSMKEEQTLLKKLEEEMGKVLE